MEFGQLFWRGFTIYVEFANLTVIVRRDRLFEREYTLVREWEGLV